MDVRGFPRCRRGCSVSFGSDARRRTRPRVGRRRRSRACCDGHVRNAGLLRLAAKEMPGRSLVPPVLPEDVLHVAVPVDSPPQILVSQERSLSVTTTRGTARVIFIRRRKKRLATALSRRFCARMSRTLPLWSTARHRYFSSPLLLISTSTRCHLPPGRERLRRSPDGQRPRRPGRAGRPRHQAAVAAPHRAPVGWQLKFPQGRVVNVSAGHANPLKVGPAA